MADQEWRVTEVLKLLRQCVLCPLCGSLVATQAGIDSHIQWHNQVDAYAAETDARLHQFSDYIVDPVNGLQKQIQDRLDTITNYVTAPTTGLESRITAAITATNQSVSDLRTQAVDAISSVRSDATNAIVALTNRVAALEALGLGKQ
jgi:hypothetical protein